MVMPLTIRVILARCGKGIKQKVILKAPCYSLKSHCPLSAGCTQRIYISPSPLGNVVHTKIYLVIAILDGSSW